MRTADFHRKLLFSESERLSPRSSLPGFIIQNTTHMELVRIVSCIDHRILLLSEDLKIVKKLSDTLINQISVKVVTEEWPESMKSYSAETLRKLQNRYVCVLIRHFDMRSDLRAFPTQNHEEMDEKRYLIGTELLCVHHEYFFRKVITRMEEMS